MADEPDMAGAIRRRARPQTAGDPPVRRPHDQKQPARDFIAENLRALFRDADREPLPESLLALLDRLAQEEGQ